VVIKDRRYHLRTYKACFIGSEAVEAMMTASIVSVRVGLLGVG